MPNGFGRGTGFGRGMGYGRGAGFGGGMGFGFRGSSPPWPYVGIGRGGLPRCGYFLSGAAGVPPAGTYQQFPYGAQVGYGSAPGPDPFYTTAPPATGYAPFAPQMPPEQELDFLKSEAEAIKGQLEQIESRMRDLESGE